MGIYIVTYSAKTELKPVENLTSPGYFTSSRDITYGATILEASSLEEAEGITLRLLLVDFPRKNGWTDHQVSAKDITDEIVKLAKKYI